MASLVKRISLVIVDKTTVEPNSIKKFQPTTPIRIKPQAPKTKKKKKIQSLKKMKLPRMNKPVLMIGTSAAAIGVPM